MRLHLGRESVKCAPGRWGAVTLKARGSPGGSILLRPNERCVAEDRRDCYCLNVMTNCTSIPELRSRPRIPPGFRATK